MLAKRLATLAPSATLAVQAKAKELKSRGIDVISFGAGGTLVGCCATTMAPGARQAPSPSRLRVSALWSES